MRPVISILLTAAVGVLVACGGSFEETRPIDVATSPSLGGEVSTSAARTTTRATPLAASSPEPESAGHRIYLRFNTSAPPFNDTKFREALSYAIDHDTFQNEILEDQGFSDCIQVPNFPDTAASLDGFDFDPNLAAALLAESGYAAPDTRPEIRLTVASESLDPPSSIAAAFIQVLWEESLGVEIGVVQTKLGGFQREVDAGDWDSFVAVEPIC